MCRSQQMASATVLVSKRASVRTRIAAVDAEMAWCNSTDKSVGASECLPVEKGLL